MTMRRSARSAPRATIGAIRTEGDLERAMAEYQRLADAADGSPEADRRAALDAAIRAFHVTAADDLRPGRPDDGTG